MAIGTGPSPRRGSGEEVGGRDCACGGRIVRIRKYPPMRCLLQLHYMRFPRPSAPALWPSGHTSYDDLPLQGRAGRPATRGRACVGNRPGPPPTRGRGRDAALAAPVEGRLGPDTVRRHPSRPIPRLPWVWSRRSAQSRRPAFSHGIRRQQP